MKGLLKKTIQKCHEEIDNSKNILEAIKDPEIKTTLEQKKNIFLKLVEEFNGSYNDLEGLVNQASQGVTAITDTRLLKQLLKGLRKLKKQRESIKNIADEAFPERGKNDWARQQFGFPQSRKLSRRIKKAVKPFIDRRNFFLLVVLIPLLPLIGLELCGLLFQSPRSISLLQPDDFLLYSCILLFTISIETHVVSQFLSSQEIRNDLAFLAHALFTLSALFLAVVCVYLWNERVAKKPFDLDPREFRFLCGCITILVIAMSLLIHSIHDKYFKVR